MDARKKLKARIVHLVNHPIEFTTGLEQSLYNCLEKNSPLEYSKEILYKWILGEVLTVNGKDMQNCNSFSLRLLDLALKTHGPCLYIDIIKSNTPRARNLITNGSFHDLFPLLRTLLIKGLVQDVDFIWANCLIIKLMIKNDAISAGELGDLAEEYYPVLVEQIKKLSTPYKTKLFDRAQQITLPFPSTEASTMPVFNPDEPENKLFPSI